MKRYIWHAGRSTFTTLGGVGGAIFVVAIPLVGFVLHLLQSGWNAMSAELQVWWVYGLQATLIVAFVLFTWNLACAPFRLERAGRLKAEVEKNEALDRLGAARDEIPKRLRLTDSLLWNSSGVVAKPNGPVERAPDRKLKFSRLNLCEPLVAGKTYYFNELVLRYESAEQKMHSRDHHGEVNSLGTATFSVLRTLPAYVEMADESA